MDIDGVAGGEAEIMLGQSSQFGILLEIVRLVCVCAHIESIHAITSCGIDKGMNAERLDERSLEACRELAAGLLQVELGRKEPSGGGDKRRMFVAGALTAVDLLKGKTEIAIREVRIAFPLQRQRTDVGVLVDADKLL